jgi:lysophospholipase L1-like esterase
MREAIQKRWRLWLVASIVLLLGILIAGPHYGEVQGARTVKDFVDAVGATGRRRHALAGVFDIGFALMYGLLAFAVASPRPGATDPSRFLRWFATGLLMFAAACDLVENVRLIVNIHDGDGLRLSSVDSMHTAGALKYRLLYAGLAVFGIALLSVQFSTRLQWKQAWKEFVAWSRASAGPYWSFIAAVAAVVVLSGLHNPVAGFGALVVLVGLPFIGSILNRRVAEDRNAAAPHRQARVILAVIQLLAGAGLIVTCGDSSWRPAGVLFFIGVAFIAMSLGAFVSELRTLNFWGPRRGPILIAVAVALLAIATFVNASKLFSVLLAIGVLLGELGAELASQDYQKGGNPDTNRRLLIGIALAAVGASLLIVGGTDPVHVAIVIALFLAAAAMASAAADGLVVVVILVIAVVWATSPVSKPLDLATDAAKARGEPYFAALGDSYLSGEGATAYIEHTNEVIPDDQRKARDFTNECRRAPTAWPFKIAQRADEISPAIPDHVLFEACSGARTYNIDTEPHYNERHKQTSPAELMLLKREIDARLKVNPKDTNAAPKFVILSIGGNDAGFGELGKSCLAPGDCSELATQFLAKIRPKNEATDPPDFGETLRATYARVRAVLPEGVPVFVVTYPMPVDAAGRCTGVLLDVNERVFIRSFTRELNRQIASAVTEYSKTDPEFFYLDLVDALTRQRRQLCASAAGSAGLNFFALHSKGGAIKQSVNPANWLHNSMHPNAKGHEAIADLAVERLREYAKTKTTTMPFTDFRLGSVRDVLEGNPVPQCDPETRGSCKAGTAWIVEQLENFYDAKFLPIALMLLGLWLAISPLMYWGATRVPSLNLPSAIRGTWRWMNDT